MDRKALSRVAVLLVMAFVCIFMVGRTAGFEQIRAVQFLLIFMAGALTGLAIGIFRYARNTHSPV